MINYKSLEEHKNTYIEKRIKTSSNELEKICGFNSKKDKILSLFSIRMKDYKKLINSGVLVFGYTYKTQYFLNKNSNFYKTWILYSPFEKYETNPELYSKIAAELNYFLENPPKKHKNLVKKLNNSDNDFAYKELPRDIFKEPIFISTIYVKESVNPSINVGVNLILINRKDTKKIVYLPEYFIKE